MSDVVVVGRCGQPWEESIVEQAGLAGLSVVQCDSLVDLLVAVELGTVELVVIDGSFPRLSSGLPRIRSKTRVMVVGEQDWADVRPDALDLGRLLADSDNESALSSRVTAVWGPPGSWGVTTIAMEIAKGLPGGILIDANVHAPSVATMLSLPEGGLLQACLAADRGAATLPVHRQQGFGVLTGVDPSLYPAVHADALRQVVDLARRQYEHVVLDLDSAVDPAGEIGLVPDWTTATSVGLAVADHVVIVVGDGSVALERLWRSLPSVAGLITGPATVVVNRCRNPRRTGREVADRLADQLPDCALGWITGPVTAKSLAPILAEVSGPGAAS